MSKPRKGHTLVRKGVYDVLVVKIGSPVQPVRLAKRAEVDNRPYYGKLGIHLSTSLNRKQILHRGRPYSLREKVAKVFCSGNTDIFLNQLFQVYLSNATNLRYRPNCQTTQSENWFGTHLPCLWTCDLRHIISVCFYVFNFCIAV